MVQKRKGKKQTQLLGIRFLAVRWGLLQLCFSYLASHPDVAVLGSSDMSPGDRAAVPIQGGELALLKREQNFMNTVVICAKLNPLCLLVCSGLIPLLCLH